MEALRQQLGEVEGHLQDRDKKYRELNANFKASTREWADRVSELEAAVKDLEGQNQQLRTELANTESKLSTGMLITPENKRYMENKYQKVKDQLAEKDRECKSLKQQLHQRENADKDGLASPASVNTSFSSSAGSPTRDHSLIVTSGHAMSRFNALRETIRQFSTAHFNENRDLKTAAIPEQQSSTLEKLTPNWKAFLSDEGYTSYLFRALIWRYLDEFFFKKPTRIWGSDIDTAMMLLGGKMSDKLEAKEWRQRTINMLHTTGRFDTGVLENLAQTIISSTEWYIAKEEDKPLVAKGVAEIVTLGAQLSSILCRSHFGIMMSIFPGSDMIHGFEPAHKTMDVRHQLRDKNIVDLMVTPCLISKAGESGYTVLEKAEVMC